MEYVDHYWEGTSSAMETALFDLGWRAVPDPENPTPLIPTVVGIFA